MVPKLYTDILGLDIGYFVGDLGEPVHFHIMKGTSVIGKVWIHKDLSMELVPGSRVSKKVEKAIFNAVNPAYVVLQWQTKFGKDRVYFVR